VLQAKARLNYCFLFKITLLWQLRFISKSEKEPDNTPLCRAVLEWLSGAIRSSGVFQSHRCAVLNELRRPGV
jgi:hypothetical protein